MPFRQGVVVSAQETALDKSSREGISSPLTFVGQWWASSVSGYPSQNRRNVGPVCETGSAREAEGMATDPLGNLYVAGAFGTIGGAEEFSPNCGAAVRAFSYDGGNPEDPAIDGNRLYLSIITRGSMPGAVETFDISSGKQTSQLTDPTVSVGVGVAVDTHHDLFWSTTNAWTAGGQVIEFRNGHMPGVLLKETRMGTDFPGGVIIDKAGNLLLIDQITATIAIFAPPYKAAPFKKIQMKGAAWYCALDSRATQLDCLDYNYAAVDVYSYPKGKYVYSYDNGIEGSQGPVGIAVQPELQRSGISW
jgi:hypothetical protein